MAAASKATAETQSKGSSGRQICLRRGQMAGEEEEEEEEEEEWRGL